MQIRSSTRERTPNRTARKLVDALPSPPLLLSHPSFAGSGRPTSFYNYQSSLVIEAKQLVLDEATGRRTHEQVMESLRETLVNAMRFGQTLYIRMADCACDFNHFSSDDRFPMCAAPPCALPCARGAALASALASSQSSGSA